MSAAPAQLQQRPQGPWNELHRAAYDGSIQRTVALLSRGLLDINQRTPEGDTALMISAERGYSSIVRILLNKGADTCAVADDGMTALHLAAHNGRLAVTALLVKAGVDLQPAASEGGTPLHLAAQNGHLEILSTLVAAGADVKAMTSNGATPLHLCAQNAHMEVMAALVEAGADLQATTPRGLTPLHLAVENGHLEAMAALAEADACLHATASVPLRMATGSGHEEVVVVTLVKATGNLARSFTRVWQTVAWRFRRCWRRPVKKPKQ